MADQKKVVLFYYTDLAEKYLYDPNSPMRNEELYIPVLDAMLESKVLNDTEKILPQGRRELAEQNRIGRPAKDFTIGNLKILAVYPDEDKEEWERHLPDFPKEWINGYDKKLVIKEKNLYDLKAIPTLYLLDKDKKVLLKDATVAQIDQYLQ